MMGVLMNGMIKSQWRQETEIICRPFCAPFIVHDRLAGLEGRLKVCAPFGLLIEDNVQELIWGTRKVIEHDAFRRGVEQNDAVCITPCPNCLSI